MYADFEYYRLTFGGTLIEETDWNTFSRQADAYIDHLTFWRLHQGWIVVSAVKMAACAVAEELFTQSKQLSSAAILQGIKSENNDGYAVTFTDAASQRTENTMRLQQAADLYLPPSHPLRYAGFYRRCCQC